MTPHEKLVSLWEISKFGIKTRVTEYYSKQRIDYVLKHPDYQDKDIINDMIERIKECANELHEEVSTMNEEIVSI